MNGSTLPAGTSDKVPCGLADKFVGDCTPEQGYGQVNPRFLFGLNAFFVTGNTAGDCAGINDLYGSLFEFHTYVPGGTFNKQYAGQFEAELASSAVGTAVADLVSLYVQGPRINGGTVTSQAVSPRIDDPSFSGSGALGPGAFALGLWSRGKSLFEGNTPNAQGTRKGVWLGGGAASGGEPAVELADGTNTWRIDNVAGELRFLKAGVEQIFSLDLSGNIATKKFGGSQGQLTMRTVLVTADNTKTAQGRFTVYSNGATGTPMYVHGFAAARPPT